MRMIDILPWKLGRDLCDTRFIINPTFIFSSPHAEAITRNNIFGVSEYVQFQIMKQTVSSFWPQHTAITAINGGIYSPRYVPAIIPGAIVQIVCNR